MHRILALSLLLLSMMMPVAGHAQAPRTEPDIRVVLLGTGGGPVTRADQVGIGTLVLAGDQVLLFDAGSGIPRALRRVPVRATDVTAVFLTHLHSDHVVAIPELHLFPWASEGRRTPFRIWGPVGTRAMMEHLQAAFAYDIHVRRDIDEHFPAEGIAVEATDIEPRVVYEANGVTVTAFLVDHAPIEPAYGYRVDYRGRSVVLSGDTKPSPELIRIARGVDLLVHEVGRWKDDPALEGDQDEQLPSSLTRRQMRIIAAHHTDPVEAGKVFDQARPRLAVFSHYAMAPDDILSLVRRNHGGRVEMGRDGMVIDIGDEVTVRPAPGEEMALEPAAAASLPILDMHLHARAADYAGANPPPMCAPFAVMPRWDPSLGDDALAFEVMPPCPEPIMPVATDAQALEETIAVMERRNIIGMVSGEPERMAEWKAAAPDRVIVGLDLRINPDQEASHVKVRTPDEIRAMHAQGAFQVLGEVMAQYEGVAANDPRLEPYWALAEELDIPVGIHMGTGGPADSYMGAAGYRARNSSPLLLEDVLVRHPKLRVYIMHAGYPLLEDLRALLFSHPQVYVDVSMIVYGEPRAAFYRYLQALVEAGFGDRIMFGSDQMIWPGVIEPAIRSIEDAPFLDAEQKRDILYNNAARFLRLSEAEIARHHALGGGAAPGS